MRIILDIDMARDEHKRKRVRLRTKFYRNADDPVVVQNLGVEIYHLMEQGIDTSIEGAIIIHEGEQT